MKLGAVWCRVSTEGQAELSLDSQESAVRAKLESEGYYVPPWAAFRAVWSSLDLASCPDFQELTRLVKDRTVAAIGTLDRDRLEAKWLQRLTFLADCRDREVKVIVCQGPPMIEEAEGQIVELALALGKERQVLRAQQGARDGLRDKVLVKQRPPSEEESLGLPMGRRPDA